MWRYSVNSATTRPQQAYRNLIKQTVRGIVRQPQPQPQADAMPCIDQATQAVPVADRANVHAVQELQPA